MKIEVVVVLYNKSVNESIALKNLKMLDDRDITICVVDNSTSCYGNAEYCEDEAFYYIDMHGNKGLSKAYNAAIKAQYGTDMFVLLDDDTEITNDYFKELKKEAFQKEDVDIFAPIIIGQDGIIYSPNEYHFLKNNLILNKGKREISQDKFNAISSCLAIRSRVFDNYEYDENLFLDLVDQYFCLRQRQMGRKFSLLDTKIHQNFSQRNKDIDAKKYWIRMKIRLKDIMTYSLLMDKYRYQLLGYIKCCGICVQTGIHLNSFGLIFKGLVESTRLALTIKADTKVGEEI